MSRSPKQDNDARWLNRASLPWWPNPFWSQDSSELLFYATDADGTGEVLMVATIETDPELRVSKPTTILDGDQYNDSYLAPMADGERFIFMDQPDRKPEDDHLTVVLNWAAELRRQFSEPW